MFGIPEWALGVGAITFAAFAGIGVMVRLLPPKARQRGQQELQHDQLERFEELERRLADVENSQGRLVELEERVDFAERLLTEKRNPESLPPPAT
jgi:hypothetical protein